MKILEQGTRVKFRIGTLVGDGKVVGVATNGAPVIGFTYIIEPDEPLPQTNQMVYPYSHFVAFQNQLEIL